MVGGEERRSPIGDTIDSRNAISIGEWGIGRNLSIETSLLGTPKWSRIIELTRADGTERGIVTTRSPFGNIMISEIFRGRGLEFKYPDFPQRLRSVLPFHKDLVVVHAHPITPEDSERLAVIPISDGDTAAFLQSHYKAAVMLDGKGIHMLTRDQFFSADERHE